MSATNLAVFLDGTWNKPDSNTNVWRMHRLLEQATHHTPYKAYYGEGVGTGVFQRLIGGAFAKGLSEDVREAYSWLVSNYSPGDRIFLFGFSRGAFTARSLAGVIARCGLLIPDAPISVADVYARYESPNENTPLHELIFRSDVKSETDFSKEESLLLQHSKRVDIQFLGLWDTVGNVGVPIGNIRGFSRSQFTFHHTRWSTLYKNYAHALAIDEERKDYLPVMLHDYIPDGEDPATTVHNTEALSSSVEQRWFPGVHSNIGGGYSDQRLASNALHWILEKAKDAGLAVDASIELTGSEYSGDLIDSYKKFLRGTYDLLPWTDRVAREIGSPPKPVAGGKIATINETVDFSAFQRWQQDSSYRPTSLANYINRSGLDPLAVHESVVLV